MATQRVWSRFGSAITAMALVWGADAAQGATLYVATTGSDTANNCQAIASPCKTITHALTQAGATGDTLQIAAGTYTEQITVSKSVTLIGAGRDATIIKAPATLLPNAAIPPPWGENFAHTAIVLVEGANTVATIQNLQVAGPGPAPSVSGGCGDLGYGVFVAGSATLTFQHNRVKDIREPTPNGCQNGRAIGYGGYTTAQVGKGVIDDNIIESYQKTGVTVAYTGSSATVSNNTLIGRGVVAMAQNGIDVGDGAVATVSNNTISDLQCSPTNSGCGPSKRAVWSTGIVLFDAASGTTLTNNVVTNSDAGVQAYGLTPPVATLTMTGNRLSSLYTNVNANGVTLNMVGNRLTGANTGLWVYDYYAGSTVVNLNGGNIITGAQTGISSEYYNTGNPVTVQGSRNQFFSNGTDGAVNNNPANVTMDLRCNWWGSYTGPQNAATNPQGQGNPATDSITFETWAVNNTDFLCEGRPGYVPPPETLAPVPVDSPWMLAALAALLWFAGHHRARQRAGR